MSDPYLGEIRIFGGNFAPEGWALCNGRLMSIAQNTALFALIGTTYGGDGVQTFALPDLQGRVPVCLGTGIGLSLYSPGQFAGEENHTLLLSEMPAHSHPFVSAQAPALDSPSGAVLGSPTTGVNLYATVSPNSVMNPAGSATIGSGQPHANVMPYLCATFIIAMQGIFPSRN
jgi:microcystin-dependent protein